MVKRSAQLEEQVTGKTTETAGKKEYLKHLRKILFNIYLQQIAPSVFSQLQQRAVLQLQHWEKFSVITVFFLYVFRGVLKNKKQGHFFTFFKSCLKWG